MTPPPKRNQNRPKSYNVTRNPSGVRQSTIALIVAQVHRHQSRHNCLPSTMEVANELEFHVTTARKAWRQALDTGQLLHPPPKCSASEEAIKARQAWGAQNHTGGCLPSTAQKIVDLLAADPEARVLWDILMAGGSRGRMSKS